MKRLEKKCAFSLAEALITLLIVSIIAVASAPIITKKARKASDTNVWTLVKAQNYIYPDKNRDLMLGSPNKETGIIVNGVLVFKNPKGAVIGWIAQDGSSSFSSSPAGFSLSDIPQEDLDRMVNAVTKSMCKQNITPHAVQPQMAPNRDPAAYGTTAPPDSQFAETDSLQDAAKSLNIDLGALLKGLQ